MRQYKSFVLAIQVILALQYVYGGFERHSQPASLMGRGISGTALFNSGHLWLNPASVTESSHLSATVFSMPSPFQLPELSAHGIIIAGPVSDFGVAAGFHRFGSPLYLEQDGVLAASLKTAPGSAAGFAVHFSHLAIQEYGSAVAVQYDAGYIARVSPLFAFGVALRNITGAHVGSTDDIPRTFSVGTALHLPTGIIVTADLVKDVRFPVAVRAGAELPVFGSIVIRTGMDSGTDRLFGGISFTVAPISAEYGIALHPELGMQHTFGIRIE